MRVTISEIQAMKQRKEITKKAEEIAEEEALSKSRLEGINQTNVTLELDLEGNIIKVNKMFEEIFKYKENDIKSKNLTILLKEKYIDLLFQKVSDNPGYEITIDLENQRISGDDFRAMNFDIGAFRKHCLLNGLDDIGLTLSHAEEIRGYEDKRRQQAPWLFI